MIKSRTKQGYLLNTLVIVVLMISAGYLRLVAAEALGKIGDVRAVEPLISVLKDSNRDVRKAAAEALEKLGMPVG